jgi:hypothetical protein
MSGPGTDSGLIVSFANHITKIGFSPLIKEKRS